MSEERSNEMKKRVVPFETVEIFLDTMRIMFLSSPRQPDYDGLRDVFWKDSFEIDCEEQESEVQSEVDK